MHSYPYDLTQFEEDGSWMIRFPDVPEAITGDPDRFKTIAGARDALSAAFESYLESGTPLPAPSRPKPWQATVSPYIYISLKAAIQQALREQEKSPADLARILGVQYIVAQRLLDPRHKSRLDALEAALTVLGKGIDVTITDIAA